MLQPVVVTGTHLPQSEAPVSQSVVVIPQAEVRSRAAANLPQLLRNTATLYVDQPGAPGGFAAVYLRGADPSHTAVMIDGVKVSDPTNPRGGGIDLSLIDPRTIARVEVLPGASSAIYGADAMAGVLNLITRVPRENRVRLGGGIGGDGFRTVFASGTVVSDGVALTASGATLNDGHRSGDAFARLRTGTLRLDAGDPAAFSANAWVRLQRHESGAFPEDSGGPRLAVLRELERRDTDGVIAALGGELPTRWGSLRLYSNLFEQDADLESPGVAPGVRDPFGLPRTSSASRYRRWAAGAIAAFGEAAGTQALVGAQYEREQGDVLSTLFFGPVQMPANFALERDTRSLFSEARAKITGAVSAQAGVRADATDAHGTHTTFQTGLRYRAAAAATLAVNYGTGFKPPSFFALGHPLVGNPGLVPERSRTLEVSVASDADARPLSYRAAVFRSQYRDLVDFDAGPPPRLVNRTTVEVSGYDVAANARINDRLRVSAGATGLEFELPSGVPALRSRPRFRATSSASYDVTPQLTASVLGSWVGRVFDSSIPTGATYLPPYLLVDASVAYTLRGVRVALGLDNLLDRNHEQFIGFPGRGRRVRIEVALEL